MTPAAAPPDTPPSEPPPSEPPLTLKALGWDDRWEARFAPHGTAGREPARVMRHDGSAVLTAIAGETRQLQLQRSIPPLAVGDWVVAAGGLTTHLLERSSLLQRLDPSTGLNQPIAANVDIVMIVCGLDRPLKPGRVQRLLAQVCDSGAHPLLVLTKADLAADAAADAERARTFDPGLEVVTVAALAGQGVDDLVAAAVDRTVVVVGESGAGKSTLVNALCGRQVADTGGVRTGDSRGRHTTTARQMQLLAGGGCLIDTPGVRAIGVWAETEAVDQTFADIADLAVDCRFSDCRHDQEPGCAVGAAVGRRELAVQRLESWRGLRQEATSTALRATEHARRSDRRKRR
ncbi:MAG TPA: ribosome small subunit-dependent GTPase A [Acidimicrobiales bacterium]|jgi:ribosome biogenesis GTPase|nr:ribosome small subunit-dependent GTPase A [Acidimicrobiales bacterium]